MVAPSNLRDLMSEHHDLLPVVVETSGAVMPEGFDSWGIKSVHSDLITTRGFRWALPGGTSISNDGLVHGNKGACPKVPGDGLCVATTWGGMASGGIPARTLLLVAYREADVVGRDDAEGKLRIGAEVATVALIDGERLIREHGSRADIRSANLRGAFLQNADLQGANLRGAYLQAAYLEGAFLRDAHLQGTYLQDAYLPGAELRGA